MSACATRRVFLRSSPPVSRNLSRGEERSHLPAGFLPATARALPRSGSTTARGEMGPDSDVDILVVKRGEFHQGRLTGDIYMSLIGVGQAVDVIVGTPGEVERAQHRPGLVVSSILGEGQVIYGN